MHHHQKFLLHIMMMHTWMMLCPFVHEVGCSCPPEKQNWSCASLSFDQKYLMPIALVRFVWILLLITPSMVELSVWMGVPGCGLQVTHLAQYLSFVYCFFCMIYNAPNSASATDDITALIICKIFSIAPLFWGIGASDER